MPACSMPDMLDEAAETLFAWRARGTAMPRLPAPLRPADEDAAYALQAAVHSRLVALRGRVVGRKIGCTTPVMQAYLGIPQPCAGGIFASTVIHRGGRVRAGSHVRLGVECEIAVRLAADLPPAGAPYDRASVAPAVEAVMAAMELVDDRYVDYADFGIHGLIADDFFNCGCVLGPPVADWHGLDLTAIEGVMRINGAEVGRGRGADIMGHPLEALAWLANRWAGLGRTLESGIFVMLGSVVQTQWLTAGDTVEINIEGLGGATLGVD